jgi:adenylylsulfate kinase
MFKTPKPLIVWIFGLPSAGKTTLAKGVWTRLADANEPSILLDGDELRRGLCEGLGFSDGDRHENLRRAAEVAALAARSGVSSVVAMITPLNSQRVMIKEILVDFRLHWVWVDCPLEECIRRDVKGLYEDCTTGQCLNMTGVDAPFEIPTGSLLRLNTAELTIVAAVDLIWSALGHLESDGVASNNAITQ